MTIRSNSNPSDTNETALKRRSNTDMNIPHLFSTTYKKRYITKPIISDNPYLEILACKSLTTGKGVDIHLHANTSTGYLTVSSDAVAYV